MLIKVFGEWINPKLITNLRVRNETIQSPNADCPFDYNYKPVGTEINFCWGADCGAYSISIDGHLPDVVAEEIDKQLTKDDCPY
jgi:hypothetical protein